MTIAASNKTDLKRKSQTMNVSCLGTLLSPALRGGPG